MNEPDVTLTCEYFERNGLPVIVTRKDLHDIKRGIFRQCTGKAIGVIAGVKAYPVRVCRGHYEIIKSDVPQAKFIPFSIGRVGADALKSHGDGFLESIDNLTEHTYPKTEAEEQIRTSFFRRFPPGSGASPMKHLPLTRENLEKAVAVLKSSDVVKPTHYVIGDPVKPGEQRAEIQTIRVTLNGVPIPEIESIDYCDQKPITFSTGFPSAYASFIVKMNPLDPGDPLQDPPQILNRKALSRMVYPREQPALYARDPIDPLPRQPTEKEKKIAHIYRGDGSDSTWCAIMASECPNMGHLSSPHKHGGYCARCRSAWKKSLPR